MPHSPSMAAQQQAQRDAARKLGPVEHAFEELDAIVAPEVPKELDVLEGLEGFRRTGPTVITEADRLAADIALARASLESRPRRSARPHILGMDARLFVADLRRMHRETQPEG